MKKTEYVAPALEIVELRTNEDILSESDVDIDVGGLFN